jgi:KDO2-lipid IV(A) lauroyltransferase
MLGPLLATKPSVTVTGHFGNFEFAGYLTGLFGIKTMTIARPLDNPYLNRFITTFRGAKGQIMVPKEGSAPLVNAHLKEGKSLVLLADQHAGEKGCWVEFLGVPASCHKSLALFTLTAGAPLVVLANRRDGRPLQFKLDFMGTASPETGGEEFSGVREMTIWYNCRLAEAISRAPEQYWWLHRRWRVPPARMAQRPTPRQAA